MNRELTTKEASIFQNALQLYDQKHYQKALTDVDKLLKKRPNHGESHCLKALIIYHQSKVDEALELLDKGLKLDDSSAVSWHMAGIIHKLEKKYPEAFKAYLLSYKYNKDNGNVLQDLSMLAMHQREFGVLADVRRKILLSRSGNNMSWLGVAVAQFLNGDFAASQKTCDSYLKMLVNDNLQKAETLSAKSVAKVDISEVHLFRNYVVEQSGDIQAALQDLEANEKQIVNKTLFAEKQAQFLLQLDRKEEAIAAYRSLIKRNPDNSFYYTELEKCLDIRDDVKQLQAVYEAFSKKYPKAHHPKVRPLRFLQGQDLEDHLYRFVSELLTRKTPSAFGLVKDLYKTQYPIAKSVGDRISEQKWDPVAATFTSRHYSYTGEHAKALEVIDAAIESDASVMELYLAKAKVLARQGAFAEAAQVLEAAANEEIGDRYLNTKAAKYALLAGDITKSTELASVFPLGTQQTSDGIKYLAELQNVNYLCPLAQAYSQNSDHGMALKWAESVAKIFATYSIDQYDFHYYGIRRGTVLAYLDLVDWEDHLYKHRRYLQAAKVGISEYIALATAEADGLGAEERAKRKSQRGKRLKQLREKPLFYPKDSQEAEKQDEDPLGESYLATKKPLEEATRLLKPLLEARPSYPETWQLSFEILLAQKKYVMALQSLKRAKEFGSSPSWVAFGAVKASYVLEQDESAPAAIKSVQKKMLASVVEKDISEFVPFIDKHVTEVLQWATARHLVQALDGVDERLAAEAVGDIKTASEAVRLAKKWGIGERLTTAVKQQWPLASFV